MKARDLIKMLADVTSIDLPVEIMLPDGQSVGIDALDYNDDESTLILYPDKSKVKPVWKDYRKMEDFFSYIRVEIALMQPERSGVLSSDEIERVTNCLAYSLKQHIRGEQLSLPDVVMNGAGKFVAEYYYDSSKTASDDPDFIECFIQAKEYICQGTPIRKTNRTGLKGTRLVDGVSTIDLQDINIWVR